jgi:hypothetical protein
MFCPTLLDSDRVVEALPLIWNRRRAWRFHRFSANPSRRVMQQLDRSLARPFTANRPCPIAASKYLDFGLSGVQFLPSIIRPPWCKVCHMLLHSILTVRSFWERFSTIDL